MKLYLTLVTIFFWSCHALSYAQQNDSTTREAILTSWNNATVKSLNTIISNEEYTSLRKQAENEMMAFEQRNDIDNQGKIDTSSLRFRFIGILLKDFNRSRDFYVIERMHAGEHVSLINYVYYPVDNIIEAYIIINTNWIKSEEKFPKISMFNEKDMATYFVRPGSGINYESVVITRFKKTQVQSSLFYPRGTLSKSSKIEQLLTFPFPE